MELIEVVRHRRMVRRYRPDPVDAAVVRRLLDTATRGPSAGWSQGLRFVVVTAQETRRSVALLCREDEYTVRGFSPWLSVAPVHVVIGVRRDDYVERYGEADKAASRGPDGWHAPFWWVDAGAALMLLLLAAVDAGLGAGFLDVPDPVALRDLLGMPDDVDVVGLVTVGYAADDQPPTRSASRGRRPTPEVVRFERW